MELSGRTQRSGWIFLFYGHKVIPCENLSSLLFFPFAFAMWHTCGGLHLDNLWQRIGMLFKLLFFSLFDKTWEFNLASLKNSIAVFKIQERVFASMHIDLETWLISRNQK